MQQQKQPELQPATKAVATKAFKEETFDKVMAQIDAFQESGDLKLPKGYVPQNALRAAWLILQDVEDRNHKKALEVCTKESVCNALLKMVVYGLSPLKKQGDFIVYSNKLEFSPEYTGSILLAKRYGGLKDYHAAAIFKGDVFEFATMPDDLSRKKILKHEQKLANIGGEVIGAYFAYELENGKKNVEIMNINQIRQAWQQRPGGKLSGAHTNFSDQMAIKTVINRGCKLLYRASDDAPLMTGDEGNEQNEPQVRPAKKEPKKEMKFDDADVVEEPEESPKGKSQNKAELKDDQQPDF